MPDDWLRDYATQEAARKVAGAVDGLHYTAHRPAVKAAMIAGHLDEAAALLLRLIEAVEREASIPLLGRCDVPPWYYKQLQAVYRKAGLKEAARAVGLRHVEQQRSAELVGRDCLDRFRAATAPTDCTQPEGLLVLRRKSAETVTPLTARPSRRRDSFGSVLGRMLGRLWR